LLEPDDRFVGARTGVGQEGAIFGAAEGLVGGCDGEDEKEGVGGARKKGQERGLSERVDVVVGKRLRQTELVDEVSHYLWIVFCMARAGLDGRLGRQGGRDEVLTKRYKGLFVLGDVDIIVSSC
jgi:hypothetical protein